MCGVPIRSTSLQRGKGHWHCWWCQKNSFQVLSRTLSVLPSLFPFRCPVLWFILCHPHFKLYLILYLQRQPLAMANLGSFPLPSVQRANNEEGFPSRASDSEFVETLPDPGLHGTQALSTLYTTILWIFFSLIKSLLDFPKPRFFAYLLRIPSRSPNQTTILLPAPAFPQSYPRSCYYK